MNFRDEPSFLRPLKTMCLTKPQIVTSPLLKKSTDTRRWIFSILPLFLLALAIVVVVAMVYFSEISQDIPICYSGDALVTFSHLRAFTEGEFLPFWPKRISRLNAPYEAWWGDFPITDLVYVIPGILAVLGCNMAAATTWTVIGLHVLAGISFYLAARWLKISGWVGCSLGILFGVAPYGFVRGLEHLMLMHYWVVPLFLAVVVRLWEGTQLSSMERCSMAGIMLATGLLNPYYFAISLVLLGFVGVGRYGLKDWRGLGWVVFLSAIGMVGFFLQNLGTFLLRWQEGGNALAVSRELWWMVKFGLYLPDMFLPQTHLSRIMEHIGGLGYHWKIPELMRGEGQRAYIGIIAGGALVWLIFKGFLSGASREASNTQTKSLTDAVGQVFFWLAMVVFVFSVAGGLNYLVGALGFPILRASNRYSIVLACLALLFLGKFLTSWKALPIWKGAVCMIILAVGIPDQWPKWPDWVQHSREQGRLDFLEDQSFFPNLETRLPDGGMVFQLPVMHYPENGPIYRMGDYEHFRPYIHTRSLRWSHGTVKGRSHADWQFELDFARLPLDAVQELRLLGFSAILVNRRAYEDDGEGMQKALESVGCTKLAESHSYLVFLL